MPSRVRALLYHEQEDKLIYEMTDSISRLMDAGCNRIVLGCNTAHLFLPAVYKNIPEAQGMIVNIIDTCIGKLEKNKTKDVYLLASEGTIESGIYQNALEKKGIHCSTPTRQEYGLVRDCIEAVKQNTYSKFIQQTFSELMSNHNSCILGCTELPILYEKYGYEITHADVYDPLKLVLYCLKEEYDSLKASNA